MPQQDFIIHARMLEIISWIYPRVITFPQKQRFVLGQQIENCSLRCLRLILEAKEARRSSTALRKLDELNIELAVLRDLLRVAYQMKFLKGKQLAYALKKIDEVGRMRGGWVKNYLPPSDGAPKA